MPKALSCPQMAGTECKQSVLLALPAELRNRIYEYILIEDIKVFAENVRKPGLLSVCQQSQREYSGICYDNNLIKLDAYYSETDSWAEVRSKQAKQTTLERSTLRDLSEFWSLASARRYCQRTCYNGVNMQRGIVTVVTDAGFRRWQWSVRL